MAVSIRRSAPHGPVGTSRGERNGFHKGGSCSGPMKRRQHICRGEIKPFYSVFLAFFSVRMPSSTHELGVCLVCASQNPAIT